MIAFACRCKHRFSLPDDQAGGVVQCPDCGRLNDVPTLDDLPHLDVDGVFDIYADRPVDDPARLAQLGIIYAKGTHDAEGDEIDMRGSTRRAEPDTIPLVGDDEEDGPGTPEVRSRNRRADSPAGDQEGPRPRRPGGDSAGADGDRLRLPR